MRFDGIELKTGSVLDIPSGTALPAKHVEGNLFFLTSGTPALYIALDTGWQKVISSTDSLAEGPNSQYFTQARVLATVVTGLSIPTDNSSVSIADSLLAAIGKLQGQATYHTTTAGGNAHAKATTTTAGFMAAADKVKLDGVVTSNATSTAAGYMSSTDKSKLDGLSNAVATTSTSGYMSATDKTKLDSVTTNLATSSTDGNMTAADKAKLDAIPTTAMRWMTADVTNANATSNTLATISELSFNVVVGLTYNFKYVIPYTAAATTTGSRWTVNGPTASFLTYSSRYTLTATSETVNYATTYNSPSASNASSLTAGNMAVIEGVLKPSVSGTLTVLFASEVFSSAIVAKAGGYLSLTSHA